ncbi:LOW QUALITY PROTEIN: uncharacterized protein LOC129013880 [Pongo pygmaeus]|uniref:LOW QUALITY PROTEIN: uncharacterized protein LOC129013880 n=1 Tax=Pongo pygmaeus TaxID=9600 RepID=UPI0023E2EB4F|nr:LOW QUALITY PROTEIN: uncharacterized protein LOC129013880 [Pongo pygmaeus]
MSHDFEGDDAFLTGSSGLGGIYVATVWATAGLEARQIDACPKLHESCPFASFALLLVLVPALFFHTEPGWGEGPTLWRAWLPGTGSWPQCAHSLPLGSNLQASTVSQPPRVAGCTRGARKVRGSGAGSLGGSGCAAGSEESAPATAALPESLPTKQFPTSDSSPRRTALLDPTNPPTPIGPSTQRVHNPEKELQALYSQASNPQLQLTSPLPEQEDHKYPPRADLAGYTKPGTRPEGPSGMSSAPGASPPSPARRPALTSSPPPPPSLTDAPGRPASRPPPPPAKRWRPAAPRYSSPSGPPGPAARLCAEAQGEAPRGPRAVEGSGEAGEPLPGRWIPAPAQSERLLSCSCCFPSFFTGSCSFRTSWSAFTLELTSSIPAPLPPPPAALSLSQQQGKSRRKEASTPLTPAEAPAYSRARPRRQGSPSAGSEAPLATDEPPPQHPSGIRGGSANFRSLPPSSLRPSAHRGSAL